MYPCGGSPAACEASRYMRGAGVPQLRLERSSMLEPSEELGPQVKSCGWINLNLAATKPRHRAVVIDNFLSERALQVTVSEVAKVKRRSFSAHVHVVTTSLQVNITPCHVTRTVRNGMPSFMICSPGAILSGILPGAASCVYRLRVLTAARFFGTFFLESTIWTDVKRGTIRPR